MNDDQADKLRDHIMQLVDSDDNKELIKELRAVCSTYLPPMPPDNRRAGHRDSETASGILMILLGTDMILGEECGCQACRGNTLSIVIRAAMIQKVTHGAIDNRIDRYLRRKVK